MTPSIQTFAKERPYPGRCIVIGKKDEKYSAYYIVTGRNIASKAKRYVWNNHTNSVQVEPTDKDIMATGDLSLLDYTAVKKFRNGIVIGNGQQIDRFTVLSGITAEEVLSSALEKESYEPDKYSTPRITGCFYKINNNISAALHTIREDSAGKNTHKVFPILLEQNIYFIICTYSGENIRPTPSFTTPPIEIFLQSETLETSVEEIFSAWAPTEDQEDLRVSVVGIEIDENLNVAHFIRNLF